MNQISHKALTALSGAYAAGWQARLELEFAVSHQRSTLVRRAHQGPLVIQKSLHPEGPEVCHGIIVHPPGGVAGGDQLTLQATLGPQSQALLTTPGAGKWYKSGGRRASQALQFHLADQAQLEWLPQENILFDGADVHFEADIDLTGQAVFAGWDIQCFGRQARGEQWQHGGVRQRFTIRRDGRYIWLERGHWHPESLVMRSPVGLHHALVHGSFVVAAGSAPKDILADCQALTVASAARVGVTALPEIVVARYLGDSAPEARQYFETLWQRLRPWYGARLAVRPRIWNT
ncbi:urease accessory protein [Methylovorus glucosotrophus]|uniref:urease accessory protein UreD n=1 Tax=Methylovorus glucosotrophus TaxID=266009 RepID=UPI001331825A|nr:urease accessory protein UreD [Methylovorus glucosotrophus]KAF0844707.1 urease accessory protein [Methylovorus glucosotrophus]